MDSGLSTPILFSNLSPSEETSDIEQLHMLLPKLSSYLLAFEAAFYLLDHCERLDAPLIPVVIQTRRSIMSQLGPMASPIETEKILQQRDKATKERSVLNGWKQI